VIVWTVLKVGKLVPCLEDSWFCGGGGGGLFGSIFGCIAWVFTAGYVIYRGVEGYMMVGWVVWIWLVCGV
jgi:hypothetical protein